MSMQTPNTPGDRTSAKPPYLPTEAPERHFSDEQLAWTQEERELIDLYVSQYPTADGAVMKVLWMAQRKFDWLPPEVVELVATSLDLPYAKVYGVATFYTQYFKKKRGAHVLDVCTCFSCQVCGGYDMLHYLEEKLGIKKGETTPDGLFTIQEAECLGACGSAPMLQVTNGPYVHNLTPAKCDALLADLAGGKEIGFASLTLPQDEKELGGNRRSDADSAEAYETMPVSQTLK